MPDKDKTPGSSAPGMLDSLTGRAVKLGALIGACAAVVTAVVTFRTQLVTLLHPPSQPSALTDCFNPELTYPRTIAVSQWDAMEIKMTGRNDCRATLAVYVAFKARRAGTVQLEAPFEGDPDCAAFGPGCWERFSPSPGELTRTIMPPRLTLLKRPLGQPVQVSINWIIYAAETGKQIRADSATVELVDDLG